MRMRSMTLAGCLLAFSLMRCGWPGPYASDFPESYHSILTMKAQCDGEHEEVSEVWAKHADDGWGSAIEVGDPHVIELEFEGRVTMVNGKQQPEFLRAHLLGTEAVEQCVLAIPEDFGKQVACQNRPDCWLQVTTRDPNVGIRRVRSGMRLRHAQIRQ